jgi:DNA-binding transcriptional MocR family regulator
LAVLGQILLHISPLGNLAALHFHSVTNITFHPGSQRFRSVNHHQIPRLAIRSAETGLHLAVTPPSGYRDCAMSERAARQNLWLWPLSPAYIGPVSCQGFIMGFGGVTVREIADATRRLRALLSTKAAT